MRDKLGRFYPARAVSATLEERKREAHRLFVEGRTVHLPSQIHDWQRMPKLLRMGYEFSLGVPLCKRSRKGANRRLVVTLNREHLTCRACKNRLEAMAKPGLSRFAKPLALNKEVVPEVLALRGSGRTVPFIATALGLTPLQVRQILQHYGHEKREHRNRQIPSSVLRHASDELAKLDVPINQTQRIAAAMELARAQGEIALMRAWEALCKKVGEKSWGFGEWWERKARELRDSSSSQDSSPQS